MKKIPRQTSRVHLNPVILNNIILLFTGYYIPLLNQTLAEKENDSQKRKENNILCKNMSFLYTYKVKIFGKKSQMLIPNHPHSFSTVIKIVPCMASVI